MMLMTMTLMHSRTKSLPATVWRPYLLIIAMVIVVNNCGEREEGEGSGKKGRVGSGVKRVNF